MEGLQPFTAEAISDIGKAGGVAARPRQARDIAQGNRIDGRGEDDRDSAGLPLQRRDDRAGGGEDPLPPNRAQLGPTASIKTPNPRPPPLLHPHSAPPPPP